MWTSGARKNLRVFPKYLLVIFHLVVLPSFCTNERIVITRGFCSLNSKCILPGRDESNLQELREVNIPNHLTGDFVLLENVKVPYQMIQIAVKRCHSDGCDTRIRQIKGIQIFKCFGPNPQRTADLQSFGENA